MDEGVNFSSDMEGMCHASIEPQRRAENSLSHSWD